VLQWAPIKLIFANESLLSWFYVDLTQELQETHNPDDAWALKSEILAKTRFICDKPIKGISRPDTKDNQMIQLEIRLVGEHLDSRHTQQ
jgi:hypothetical protein